MGEKTTFGTAAASEPWFVYIERKREKKCCSKIPTDFLLSRDFVDI